MCLAFGRINIIYYPSVKGKMNSKLIIFIAATVILIQLNVLATFFEHVIIDLIVIAALIGILLLFRERLADFGLSSGNIKLGLKYSVILFILALPLMLYGSSLESFKNYYPIWDPANSGIKNFIIFELAVGVMMFYTEFLYRGFILFGLSKNKTPGKYANLIQSFIYMLRHIGKPGLEVPYSFFAGYVFGLVDLRCKSILPSFLMHFTASVVFDLMIIFLWT